MFWNKNSFTVIRRHKCAVGNYPLCMYPVLLVAWAPCTHATSPATPPLLNTYCTCFTKPPHTSHAFHIYFTNLTYGYTTILIYIALHSVLHHSFLSIPHQLFHTYQIYHGSLSISFMPSTPCLPISNNLTVTILSLCYNANCLRWKNVLLIRKKKSQYIDKYHKYRIPEYEVSTDAKGKNNVLSEKRENLFYEKK